MNWHPILLTHQDHAIMLLAGYDRPLQQLFLQVLHYEESRRSCEDDICYDSMQEPGLDWSVIGTLTDKLAPFRTDGPEGMIEGEYLDQQFNAGNRVVRHYVDRPPEELLAGRALPP